MEKIQSTREGVISPSMVQETLVSCMGPLAGLRRAVMFSGGFDSMLMARLAEQGGARVTAVTVAFEDLNPLTVAGSLEFAAREGIAHHILRVETAEFLSAFEALAGIMDEPLSDLDMAVVYAALKKYDPAIAGDVFISGMGSDQWLGNEALKEGRGELQGRMDKAKRDVNAHQRVAQVHGCSFVFPFLSAPMLSLSRSIPSAMKKDKKLLRMMAAARSIPRNAAGRELQVPHVIRNLLTEMYGPGARRASLLKKSLTARKVRI